MFIKFLTVVDHHNNYHVLGIAIKAKDNITQNCEKRIEPSIVIKNWNNTYIWVELNKSRTSKAGVVCLARKTHRTELISMCEKDCTLVYFLA